MYTEQMPSGDTNSSYGVISKSIEVDNEGRISISFNIGSLFVLLVILCEIAYV